MAGEPTYVAVRGFQFPTSLAVRNRIRKGERIPFAERGETQNVSPGETIRPPKDLLEGWLQRGLIQEATNDAL